MMTLYDISQLVIPIGYLKPDSATMMGTGFFIDNEGLIVTLKHVIDFDIENLVAFSPRIRNINQYQDMTDFSCNYHKAEVIEVDPFRDIAIIKTNMRFPGQIPKIKGTDSVHIGSEVGIIGFPHCPTSRNCLTFQKAEVGAKILLGNYYIKSKCIVINTQARPGQSGSLIYNIQTQEIVALLVGAYVPPFETRHYINGSPIDSHESHQTTHCISTEYISNMI